MEDLSQVTNDALSSVKSESKEVREQQTHSSKPVDAASRTSTSSRSSSSCKTIIEAAARASAEGAATKVAYAKKQLEIKKQRAVLEIQLEELEIEKEAEVARVKAKYLEAAAAIEHEDVQSVSSSVPPDVIHKRTKDYVQRQSQLSLQSPSPCNGASGFERFEDEPREWPLPAAEKRTLPQSTLRAPMDEQRECEQGREDIAEHFYGSSAVRRSKCDPTQQPPPTITTRPDVFRPPPEIHLQLTLSSQPSLHAQQDIHLQPTQQ